MAAVPVDSWKPTTADCHLPYRNTHGFQLERLTMLEHLAHCCDEQAKHSDFTLQLTLKYESDTIRLLV